MKYKIKIEQIEEYDEKQTVYEMGTTRYYSKFHSDLEGKKQAVDYEVVEYPTGKKLERTKEVYEQEFEGNDITEIIKAVNNI